MGFIQDIINGIKYMIETFRRIICFFDSVPTRIRNINSGFKNVFNGINAEFDAIGKSFNMGFSSINTLVAYAAEFINTYVGCGFKYFQNFFDCIFYYLVDMILYVLYLPIMIIIWAFKKISIDFSYVEERVYNGLKMLNDLLYPIIGFQIIHWPKPIRDKCYLCKRLKVDAVKKKANDVSVTFKEKIPKNFGKSRDLFRIGKRQFDEVFELIAREPHEIS